MLSPEPSPPPKERCADATALALVMMSLRSSSMIELQQSTQPFSALYFSFVAFFRCWLRKNEVVSDALMITFQMVMSCVLFEYIVNRPLAEENHSVQTFGLDPGAQ